MDSSLVSIIVPMYNVENYISDCLESLVNQTYQNIEIIIINDGSRDKSNEIALTYSKMDDRIKIIEQTNGGSGKARNVGIKKSKGKFLIFVDGDGKLELDAVENLFQLIVDNDCDVVWFNENIIDEEGSIIYTLKEQLNSNEVLLGSEIHAQISSFVINGKGNYSCCNKIYNKRLIVKNLVLFPETTSFGGDYHFFIDLMRFVKKILYVDKAFYNIREYESYLDYVRHMGNICYKNAILKFDYLDACNILNKSNVKIVTRTWFEDVMKTIKNEGNPDNNKVLSKKAYNIRVIKNLNKKVCRYIGDMGIRIPMNLKIFFTRLILLLPSKLLAFAANIAFRVGD